MNFVIALCYYFIACGLKAHKKFVNSPVDELPGMQKTIYDELPLEIFMFNSLGTFGIIGTFGIFNRFKVPEVPKMPESN